jgi:hypothetical protein
LFEFGPVLNRAMSISRHYPSSNAMMFTQLFHDSGRVLLLFVRADDDKVVFFTRYRQPQLLNGFFGAMAQETLAWPVGWRRSCWGSQTCARLSRRAGRTKQSKGFSRSKPLL